MNLSDNEHIEKLLADPDFRLWVSQPTDALDAYWQLWRKTYPEQEESFWLAKETVLALLEESLPISRERAGINIERILRATADDKPESLWSVPWLTMAATVLLLVAVGGYWWMAPQNLKNPDALTAALQKPDTSLVTYTNARQIPAAVTLPDGSTVIVFPKSSVRYPALFSDSVRSVQLSGEAFFEVTKDPAHPFVISSAHLNTRVTGTSFRVRDTKDQPPSVRVKTGSVEVFLTAPTAGTEKHRDALILKAHQQVTFEKNRGELPPAVVSSGPDDSVLPIEINNYNYRRTAVPEVLLALQETYGISIHYDHKKLEHCSLTAKLGDQPLMEKLRMICLGLNLHFEINTDHSITITGNGCG